MKTHLKALAGLAAVIVAVGGAFATTPAQASSIHTGWSPLPVTVPEPARAGLMITDLPPIEAAGCEQWSSWTLGLRPFNDPDGDGYNNDLEPVFGPNSYLPLTPGNALVSWWHANTEVIEANSSMTLGPGVSAALPMTPGVHRFALAALCVTDNGDPDFLAKDAKIDAMGRAVGQWFTIDIATGDRTGDSFSWVNVPAFGGTPPPPRNTVTVVETIHQTTHVPVTVPGPTSTIVVMMDGIGTVTKTVPTATATVHQPAATVTVTPDPFAARCHTPGVLTPWWCSLDGLYWALVKGWIQ